MTEFEKYIQRYLDLIPTENWMEELVNCEKLTLEIYSKLNEETSLFKYAEKKWTFKEVLQHLIDCERIFQYRALSISRGDTQNLPGFDEELFAENSNADERHLEDLIAEHSLVRASSLILFKSFKKETLSNKGFANGNEISVETIGKLIVGHNLHHLNVIEERYL
ncbi:DinB family protein [Halpernia frigidisoli]|uniref:DinB superfamily protein n=1 Tax=Halpernia frigidisoli TaxID=1125876 RepID=A0A1I3FLH9_9FLAO|nr:DinB family protein [Halpernia frigidisoli]SFI11972.1 DinB superfamily protein [Halpernia frigidisoli]